MKKDVRINFYDVLRCGYYNRGGSEAVIGDCASALADLHRWITGDKPTIRETQSFTPAVDSEVLPVHCYNIYKPAKRNEFLLTTWNETETGDGVFASVYADQAAGNADVEAQDVPDGTIPGYPAYFWFIPERNIVATIRVDNRLNGHQGMNLYLRGFLERFSRWVVTEKRQPKSLTVDIAGYSLSGDSEILRVRPDFKSAPVKKQGEIRYIRSHWKKIRKMIRTDEYKTGRSKSASFLRKALHAFGLSGDAQVPEDTRYRCEMTYQPTKDELDEIIQHWENDHTSRWDDVGFMFSGDGEIKWLSRTTARDIMSLDIDYKNDVVIDEESLMAALAAQRDQLLGLLGE